MYGEVSVGTARLLLRTWLVLVISPAIGRHVAAMSMRTHIISHTGAADQRWRGAVTSRPDGD